MHRKRICFAMLLALGVALSACAPSSARITRVPTYPLELGPVFVSLKSQDHDEAVRSALVRAGIPIAEGPNDVQYTLRVHVGTPQWTSRDCGALRNAKYLVDFAVDPQQSPVKRSQLKAIRISAKGYDGDCHPNVFDDMSELLRESMMDSSMAE